MALTKSQLESQRRYRAKLKEKLGQYSESQKKAQYKYLNKIRESKGLQIIITKETNVLKNIDL